MRWGVEPLSASLGSSHVTVCVPPPPPGVGRVPGRRSRVAIRQLETHGCRPSAGRSHDCNDSWFKVPFATQASGTPEHPAVVQPSLAICVCKDPGKPCFPRVCVFVFFFFFCGHMPFSKKTHPIPVGGTSVSREVSLSIVFSLFQRYTKRGPEGLCTGGQSQSHK